MSKLKAITPKAAPPCKPKILIFGKPGVGKTWTSLDFPNCYYIDTEGGANMNHYTDKLAAAKGVYFGIEQGSLDFNTVLEQIKALATEKHNYKTVVIDSLTKIYNNEIAREADRLGDKNAFGADKKPAVSLMRQLTSWIQRLDMNVIIIAHEKSLWGVDDKKQRAEIGVTFDAWDKLEYELHLALNIVKLANNRRAVIKKSRLTGFPDGDNFPWSYQDFATRYGKDIIEKDSAQLILATEEQLSTLDKLLEKAILPQGIIDKWFNAANVISFKDMDSKKLATIIELINNKYLAKGE
jgi:hypothetical protein